MDSLDKAIQSEGTGGLSGTLQNVLPMFNARSYYKYAGFYPSMSWYYGFMNIEGVLGDAESLASRDNHREYQMANDMQTGLI